MRRSRFADTAASGLLALLCALGTGAARAAPAGPGADEATVAWLRDGHMEVRVLTQRVGTPVASATPSTTGNPSARNATSHAVTTVPLGSLWKLFVYAYLVDSQAQESAYVCAATNTVNAPGEDRYCCEPGQSVARNTALARSCAPYFEPSRLALSAPAWRAHWQARSHAAWLLDLPRLQPETEVDLGELLQALAALSPNARGAARQALLETALQGYGREAWSRLGTGLRYKTYSWHSRDGSALGGAAGWLADGTPFWFGARGSSRTALSTWATPLAQALPTPRWREASRASADASCVDVDFFARYPLRAVWRASEPTPAKPGALSGAHRLQFANGNWLGIAPQGELTLAQEDGAAPRISGRLGLNDYVARVIDREGHAQSPQAARALAIAARSYLLQNAHFEGGCWRIADASATQRVSPNPPSDAALAAAWFTDDVILHGSPVHYHLEAAGTNRLAWRDALARAAEGWDFERILQASYPQATLAALSGRLECARLEAAESWLAHNAALWQRKLRAEPGFEPPPSTLRICALADGHPYADQQRLRIYVRGWRSLNERVTLAHEYLHLALRFHPNGANEDYVERLARRLIEN